MSSPRNLLKGKDLPEDRQKELSHRARAGSDEIFKAMDVGAFSLSDKALGRLRKYKKEIEEASKLDNPLDYIDVEIKAAKECLEDFIGIALKDLKTK